MRKNYFKYFVHDTLASKKNFGSPKVQQATQFFFRSLNTCINFHESLFFYQLNELVEPFVSMEFVLIPVMVYPTWCFSLGIRDLIYFSTSSSSLQQNASVVYHTSTDMSFTECLSAKIDLIFTIIHHRSPCYNSSNDLPILIRT